jgi:hypothetical protein
MAMVAFGCSAEGKSSVDGDAAAIGDDASSVDGRSDAGASPDSKDATDARDAADTGGASDAPSGTTDCETITTLSPRLVQTSVETKQDVIWDSYIRPIVYRARGERGVVAWSGADKRVHVDSLTKDLALAGDEVVLPFETIHALYLHDDGSFAALVAKREGPDSPDSRARNDVPNSAYLVKVDKDGRTLFTTHVAGGSGYVATSTEVAWFLTKRSNVEFDGSRYGLHYTTAKSFPDGGVHEGDEFLAIAEDGSVVPKSRLSWIASHGFDLQALVAAPSEVCTVTIADPFPERGLLYRCPLQRDAAGEPVAQVFVWPPKADRDLAMKVGEPIGTLGTARRVGDEYFATLSTWITGEATAKPSSGSRPVLVKFDAKGALVKATVLSETWTPGPGYSAYTYLAPFGPKHLLVAWAQIGGLYQTDEAMIGVFDLDGRKTVPAAPFKVPFLHSNEIVSGPVGDPIWVHNPAPRAIGFVRFRAPVCR